MFLRDPSLPVFVGRPLIEGRRPKFDTTEVPHVNDCWSIYVIRSGQGRFHHGETAIPMFPGSVFFIGLGEAHWVQPDGSFELMNILFRPEALEPGVWSTFQRRKVAGPATGQTVTGDESWQLPPARLAKLVALAIQLDRHVHAHGAVPRESAHRRAAGRVLGDILNLLIQEKARVGALPVVHARQRRLIWGLQERLQAGYEEKWTVARMVSLTGLKPTRLFAAFKRETGCSPVAWLLAVRLEQARRLLLSTQRPVAEVAADCGFADPNYFTRIFRQRVGRSPTAFRQASK